MAPLFQGFFVARPDSEQGLGSSSSLLCCKLERNPSVGSQEPGADKKQQLLLEGRSDATLASFCFPLGRGTVKEWTTKPPQEFTFTLTGSTGDRLNGFCLVSWSTDNRPQVFCLLSSHCYFSLFSQILRTAQEFLGAVPDGAPAFLPAETPLAQYMMEVSMYCPPLPSPMSSFTVQGRELCLPGDIGNGHWNSGSPVAAVFEYLSPSVVMDVVSAILMERRVLFVSSSLESLSKTVHAMAALIYPFRWQHIFLPIIPEGLLDYLQAPMPWIAGLPRQLLPHLAKMELDDAVVVNLESGKVKLSETALVDASRFPWRERLYEQMTRVMDAMDRCDAPGGSGSGHDSPLDGAREHDSETLADVLLASVMRDFFLRVLGSYRYFIHSTNPSTDPSTPGRHREVEPHALQEGGRWFDHESFRKAQRSGRVRGLLEGMRCSQVYEVFVRERLTLAAEGFENSSNDIFEADVAALAQSGSFEKRRFSVTRLHHMSSSLMSHIKAFHQDRRHHAGSAKSAFKNGVERMMSLPSSLRHSGHSFEAAGSEQPTQRARSMMVSPKKSSQIQHKVSGAGKSVGRAAAVMSGRMRKQASKLEGLMWQGPKRRSMQDIRSDEAASGSDSVSGGNSEDERGRVSDPEYPAGGILAPGGRDAADSGDDSSPGPGSPFQPRDSVDGTDEPLGTVDTFDFPFQMRGEDGGDSTSGRPGHARSDSLASEVSVGIERRPSGAKSLEALFGESLLLEEADAAAPQHPLPLSPLANMQSQWSSRAPLIPEVVAQEGVGGIIVGSHRIDPFEGLGSSCGSIPGVSAVNSGPTSAPAAASSSDPLVEAPLMDPFAALCAPAPPDAAPPSTNGSANGLSLLDL